MYCLDGEHVWIVISGSPILCDLDGTALEPRFPDLEDRLISAYTAWFHPRWPPQLSFTCCFPSPVFNKHSCAALLSVSHMHQAQSYLRASRSLSPQLFPRLAPSHTTDLIQIQPSWEAFLGQVISSSFSSQFPSLSWSIIITNLPLFEITLFVYAFFLPWLSKNFPYLLTWNCTPYLPYFSFHSTYCITHCIIYCSLYCLPLPHENKALWRQIVLFVCITVVFLAHAWHIIGNQ